MKMVGNKLKYSIKHLSFVLSCILLLAFSCKKDDKEEQKTIAPSIENNEDGQHTYNIEIIGGKKYQGEIPKVSSGVYYPIAFVEFNEEVSSKVISGILSESGQFQFGIGVALDNNNNPKLHSKTIGLTFGEWGAVEKYRPSGTINMTLKNYKEHKMTQYGDDAIVASFTLTFSGKFKLGEDGQEVNVNGELVIAAP